MIKLDIQRFANLYFNNNDRWNRIVNPVKQDVPLRGSNIAGPLGWKIIQDYSEMDADKNLYFLFKKIEEPTGPDNMLVIVNNRASSEITGIDVSVTPQGGTVVGDYVIGSSEATKILSKQDESTFDPWINNMVSVDFAFDGDTLDTAFADGSSIKCTVSIYINDGTLSNIPIVNGTITPTSLVTEAGYIYYSEKDPVSVNVNYSLFNKNYNSWQEVLDSYPDDHPQFVVELFFEMVAPKACLSEDTKIKTLNGNLYISDLELGDKVLDKNNQETEVIKTYNHKINKVYKISLSNGEIIECSHDHKFVLDNNEIKTADQLTKKDILNNISIENIEIENKEIEVYEIKTQSNTYQLNNGIVCECEEI